MGKTYGQYRADSCACAVYEIQDNRLVTIQKCLEVYSFPILIHQGYIGNLIFFNCPLIFCSSLDLTGHKEEKKKKAHQAYLRVSHQYFERVQGSIQQWQQKVSCRLSPEAWSYLQDTLEKIEGFLDYAELLIKQIKRRVLEGEAIPAKEKIYSIFQPHTEWISKGKAGVLVELGVKVCILEDQHLFILHHQVMEKLQDVDIAVAMITETQKNFPLLNSCSYDKGFHSPANQEELRQHLDQVVLPKKGKRSSAEKIKTNQPNYKKTRRQHSAIESAINALEQHGLDRCPDHGIDGFRRYVALGVLAHNLQRLGVTLIEKERAQIKRKQRREPYRQAA